ncbi:MAG TPA: hypothetical protein VK174_01330 [Chitinophagales bacterium]|nr:hypothetical protein [Chitinophagales bacterium]
MLFIGCRQKTDSPSTDPAQNPYYQLYNQIYINRGQVPADTTKIKLQQYLKQFPENADAWMLAGNEAYVQADFNLAIINYRYAIARQPGQSLYYSALGAVYNVQNEVDSAKKYLLKAISLGDTSAYTYLNTALLYIKVNDKAKSLAWADSTAARMTQTPSPVLSGGISFIYSKWGEEENSEKWFEKAVQLGLKDTFAFRQVLSGNKQLEVYYRETYPYL